MPWSGLMVRACVGWRGPSVSFILLKVQHFVSYEVDLVGVVFLLSANLRARVYYELLGSYVLSDKALS